MRAEMQRILALGRISPEADTEADWAAWQEAVKALRSPAPDGEALALLDLLPVGEDSGSGVARSLLHFIESAPGWPGIAPALADGYW